MLSASRQILLAAALALAGTSQPLLAATATVAEPSMYELEVDDLGVYRIQASVRSRGTQLEIRSSRGGVQRAIGFWRTWLLALTSPQGIGGELLRISGPLAGTEPGSGWVFPYGAARARIASRQPDHADLQVELYRGGQRIARLQRSATPAAAGYGEVVSAIRTVLEEHFYDAAELHAAPFAGYLERLDRAAQRARDDLEFAVQAHLAKGRLPLSHVGLERHRDCRKPLPAQAGLETSMLAPDVAYVKVSHLLDQGAQIAALKARLLQEGKAPRALVLDLRGAHGGDLSAMDLASLLLAEPPDGGYFLTRKWWDGQRQPPTAADLDGAAVVSSASAAELQAALLRERLVRIVAPAAAQHYDGEVYLLTSRQTGSAAEVLAAFLQASGRATLVGEPTAGKMLSSAWACVGDGWVFQFPAADYYTAQGQRLEGRPTQPDVVVESTAALDQVRARLGLAHGPAAARQAGVTP